MLFPFFHLLRLAPTVNNPHVCIKNSLSLISRDSRTPRNSGTNFNLEGENVTGYRYMIHLYCLAVQAGFYSDVVECRTLSPADRVRSPVGKKCYFHFFTCYTTPVSLTLFFTCPIFCNGSESQNKNLLRQN